MSTTDSFASARLAADTELVITQAGVPRGPEIVFIAGNLPDLALLQQSMGVGREVYVLDPVQDGLAQIGSILDGRGGISAIHLVTHGADGTLGLGTLRLDADNLAEHATQLQAIGRRLSADADVLLYGCDIGAGSIGQAFVEQLAAATGADVAASSDTTGAAGQGGDWDLEVRSGDVDAAVAVDAALADQYLSILALSNVTTTWNTAANFISFGTFGGTSAADVIYEVSGDTNYRLKVDGASVYTYAYDYLAGGDYQVFLSGTSLETLVTFTISDYYAAAKVFTPETLWVRNYQGNGAQTLVFNGYDASDGLVATQSFGLTDTGGGSNQDATLSFTNFAGLDIKTLKLTATTNGSTIQWISIDDFKFTSVSSADTTPPTVTDGNISISGASGTGGAFKIGDTVTATWNNTAGGDNNTDVSTVTVDFSQFGGGAAVSASNSSDIWTATYTIVAGAIDGTSKNVSVTATDTSANPTTTADTSNATLDNVAPTVTDGNISISGASGTGGAFKIGDTVTATWNNTAGGDNNSDTVSAATVDFSAFGGGAAVSATDSSGTWTATYTIVAGAIDGTNKNVSVTATDNAGNTTTTADTSNATLDNVAPTVTDGNISISGASGTGGAFKIGDTVTATWNNTAGGDNNSDTVSAATVDFSAFGGGAAVSATDSSGTWTATYTIVSGSIDGVTNRNVSVTATDDAGNTTTTADGSNATVDNVVPTVTGVDSATADGNYHATDVVSITVDFGEAVTVTGTPQLTLETGTTDEVADFVSGSGTSTLTFQYTVQSGDTSVDLDYIGTSALALNGGTIVDAAGNDATLTLASPGAAGSLGANADVQIDVNLAPTGGVTVTGTSTQGQVLTADTSTLADGDGLGTFSYRWMRDGGTIALATASTYTLVQADVGAVISVEVSYTDGFSHAEAVSSADTAAVANVNDAPTGSVVITGSAMLGQTVTADASGLADADGLGTFSYQWFTGGSPIGGATLQDYTITADDLLAVLTVEVSYTDGFGASEAVVSSPVAPSTTSSGSGGKDVLMGGVGDDVLDGGIGRDKMTGGAGDDTYYVDNRGDVVVEAPGEGNDTVNASVQYTLPDNVENLILTGGRASRGYGNDLDNTIVGSDSNNRLLGGLGADTLTGGEGADRFIWKSPDESPNGAGTYDVVTDFNAAERDRLDLKSVDGDSTISGGQRFHFIGTAAFSATDATGELRFDPGTHMLYGSTDADTAAEFAIELTGVTELLASDLQL